MNKLIKFASAFAIALAPIAAAQPAAAQITAQVKTTMTIIGMLATGSEASKAKFDAAAKAAGFSTTRSKNNRQEDEVMVVTFGSKDPVPFWALYRAALAGKYGALKVEVITVPLDADPDAKDYLDKARIFGSEQVYEPKN
ncbi:MAG: hypothetical protein ACKOOL_08500 [Novosphingobium sp.]